ncbi:hypothetical protein IWX49DRAFT_569647 [Phyllosticta citricarpa]|uniref:Uncharacterized protein n=2 Tax=Phyllosticta TaxID=121621 RepID=A0ABR1LDT1_9PEZI
MEHPTPGRPAPECPKPEDYDEWRNQPRQDCIFEWRPRANKALNLLVAEKEWVRSEIYSARAERDTLADAHEALAREVGKMGAQVQRFVRDADGSYCTLRHSRDLIHRLQRQVTQRDERIEALEARIGALEAGQSRSGPASAPSGMLPHQTQRTGQASSSTVTPAGRASSTGIHEGTTAAVSPPPLATLQASPALSDGPKQCGKREMTDDNDIQGPPVSRKRTRLDGPSMSAPPLQRGSPVHPQPSFANYENDNTRASVSTPAKPSTATNRVMEVIDLTQDDDPDATTGSHSPTSAATRLGSIHLGGDPNRIEQEGSAVTRCACCSAPHDDDEDSTSQRSGEKSDDEDASLTAGGSESDENAEHDDTSHTTGGSNY